jgi:hypothetical protein
LGWPTTTESSLLPTPKKAAPLTDLLKKNENWHWTDQCQAAFDKLKVAVASEPVLHLPNFELPFEVHTDASDKAIGGVLVQEGHHVAFESRSSRKLSRSILPMRKRCWQ